MARKKPEIADMSTRLLLVELGSEKRWKRLAVIGALGVGVLGGAVVGVMRVIDSRDVAAREGAWNGLSACLLGEPLKDGEAPEARLQAIQIGFVGVPMDRRAKQPSDPTWPSICAPYAFTLEEHAGSPALGEAAKALAVAMKADANATADLRPLVEKVWAEAATAKLKAAPDATAPTAPKPAPLLFTAEAFKALPKFLSGTFSFGNVREAPAYGTKLYFLVDQKEMPEGPVLCTAASNEATIHCQRVPPAVATLSPGLRLLGTTDEGARPFYFAGDRGQLGIFPPEGKAAIDATVTYGASAHADGSLTVVTRKDGAKDIRLIYHPATGLAVERPLLQPADFESPNQAAVFWDWVVYKGAGKAGAPPHLYARKLGDGPADAKPAVDVGEADEPAVADKADKESQLSGCKSDDTFALRLRGARVDTLAFFAGGRWGAPVKGSNRNGVLTCRGMEAITTSVENAVEGDKNFATISQSRCNSSGCTPVSIGLKQMLSGLGDIVPSDTSGIVAADVGGKLAVIWNGGLLGGLRMRFGAPDRMKEVEDTIIADGREGKDAKLSSFVGLKVIPASNWALLLVNTTSGVKALRIEPDGKVTPLQASL
jgi:hypothetical protein